ncbi:sodium/hydrogen exchanger 6 [Tanacetum coccineum]
MYGRSAIGASFLVLIENRGEAGEDDSIHCIVNNFSKVIDEMNPSTTNSHDQVSSLAGRPRSVVASVENQNVSQPDGRTIEHVETFNAPQSLTGNYSSPADVVISQALDAPIIQTTSIRMESSYAGVTSSQQPKPSQGEPTNFMYRQVDNVFEGVDISMPRRVMENVSTRFENTLYGYFIGKRLAFPVVEYYVKNNWAKFGLKRIMLNAKGFFFFKFESRVGLENVLEGGPRASHIPIWVKLHDVPLEVFDEEGISILGSHLGKPIMLDAYTIFSNESFSIGIPVLDGHPDGPLFTKEAAKKVDDVDDGFQQVSRKKKKPQNVANSSKSQSGKGGFQAGLNNNSKPLNAATKPSTSTNEPRPEPSDIGISHLKKRIILGWNDDNVDIMIMAQTSQVMHCQINTRADNRTLFCSFVYADNYYVDRRVLWSNLAGHASFMHDKPWVLLSDFNAALNLEDHSCSGYEPNIAMREFKECVQRMEVMDVNATGLEVPLRKLLHNQGNLHDRVNRLRVELDEAQKAIDLNLSCSSLREKHAHYLLAFKEASLDEERFLRQKSKIEWLDAGDSNTLYLHKIVKSKNAHNRVEMVKDISNVLQEGNVVAGTFVSHYEQFLGIEGRSITLDTQDLFVRVLDDQKAVFMVREVSDSEIKGALFSMGDDKAPGPDVLQQTACVYKKSMGYCWDDFTFAIRDFFANGKLLREVNPTIIALIPKVTIPSRINDYRPISCCSLFLNALVRLLLIVLKGILSIW